VKAILGPGDHPWQQKLAVDGPGEDRFFRDHPWHDRHHRYGLTSLPYTQNEGQFKNYFVPGCLVVITTPPCISSVYIVSYCQTAFFFYVGAWKKGSGDIPLALLSCRSPDFGDNLFWQL